jgi:hypothetical protein
MFSKRHFEVIAAKLQRTKPQTEWNDLAGAAALTQWECDRNALADLFAMGNGNFDRDRFIRACEPGANVPERPATQTGRGGRHHGNFQRNLARSRGY